MDSDNSSRRPSESIRERGREVIERRTAAGGLRQTVYFGLGAGPKRFESASTEAEADLRRLEDLEAAENKQLELEGKRARARQPRDGDWPM
jgi:hypothetical protein